MSLIKNYVFLWPQLVLYLAHKEKPEDGIRIFNANVLCWLHRICDEFEEMSRHASERPKETPEVVALQNYINMCREDKIFKLKQEIKQTAERVMFLLYNSDVDGKLNTIINFVIKFYLHFYIQG